MISHPFGKTGRTVSCVGLGTWNLGNQWGDITNEESDVLLRTAVDSGMTLIDTADSYGIPHGKSELRIGRVLHEFPREKLTLVSKIHNWGFRTGQGLSYTTPDMVRLCGHAILGRMKTEYVDTLLCHNGGIEDPSIFIEGFNQLVEEGHLRNYGISTNSLEVLKRFHEMSGGRCAVTEVDYSLLNREAEEAFIPFCQEQGIGILVRGPLSKGILSGRYDLETEFTDTVRSGWNKGKRTAGSTNRNSGSLHAFKPWWAMPI